MSILDRDLKVRKTRSHWPCFPRCLEEDRVRRTKRAMRCRSLPKKRSIWRASSSCRARSRWARLENAVPCAFQRPLRLVLQQQARAGFGTVSQRPGNHPPGAPVQGHPQLALPRCLPAQRSTDIVIRTSPFCTGRRDSHRAGSTRVPAGCSALVGAPIPKSCRPPGTAPSAHPSTNVRFCASVRCGCGDADTPSFQFCSTGNYPMIPQA